MSRRHNRKYGGKYAAMLAATIKHDGVVEVAHDDQVFFWPWKTSAHEPENTKYQARSFQRRLARSLHISPKEVLSLADSDFLSAALSIGRAKI